MTKQTFVAYYEDAAKVEATAKARGFTGNDSNGQSWHDFVEAEDNKFRASKAFPTLESAVDWLKAEITARKSVYGCGTIVVQEPVTRRCAYCVCAGTVETREYTIDDSGIAEETARDSLCFDGDSD